MEVKNNLKLIFTNLWLNILKHAQYKTSFILSIVMMIFNNLFFIVQWVIIFQLTPDVGGYGLNDILLIWGLIAGSFGLCTLFFDGSRQISQLIYTGKLDVFLTQPKNVLINVSSSSSSMSAIGDFLYCFIILIIIKANFWTWIAIIPLIACSALIMASMFAIFSSLGFYIKRGDALTSAFSSVLISFGNYPITIFNTAIKIMFFTLIPVGFMFFIPLQLILSFNWLYLAAFIGFTVLSIFLAFVVFNKGLKRYSSGNLLSPRL